MCLITSTTNNCDVGVGRHLLVQLNDHFYLVKNAMLILYKKSWFLSSIQNPLTFSLNSLVPEGARGFSPLDLVTPYHYLHNYSIQVWNWYCLTCAGQLTVSAQHSGPCSSSYTLVPWWLGYNWKLYAWNTVPPEFRGTKNSTAKVQQSHPALSHDCSYAGARGEGACRHAYSARMIWPLRMCTI